MFQEISIRQMRETFLSLDFQEFVKSLEIKGGSITSFVSQATLYYQSRALAPANILEIGSYFGNTTRVLAQSVADAGQGSVVTIDPFGEERLPGIIASWPTDLSSVTTFFPVNSMSYFASLEVAHTKTGKDGPFNLIFVDGHHSFEYALFDLLSSAIYLRPGGAIVVDNIDQAGPAMAVEYFMSRYRAWKLFSQSGKSLSSAFPESVPGTNGAILLAPAGIEIGSIPYKFQFSNLVHPHVGAVRLPLVPAGSPGRLSASANLFSLPYDVHITGVGMVAKVANVSKQIAGTESELAIDFPGLAITPHTDQANTTLEIELRFEPDQPEGANTLVDVARNIDLVQVSAASPAGCSADRLERAGTRR